jgi:hypothetical protein
MGYGNIHYQQIAQAHRQGNGSKIQMFGGGTPTAGDIAVFDSNGNVVPLGAAGGTGMVTLKTATGTFSTSGDHNIIAAVAGKKLRVVSYSITTTGTTAMVCTFKSGTTELWKLILQAPSGAAVGANLSTQAPYHLFETGAGVALNLNTDQAQQVAWSVTYYEA